MKSLMLIMIALVILAREIVAEAQQPKKVPHIGYLSSSAAYNSPRSNAFREGLRDLGYVEGKNISVEYHYAEGKLSGLPDLAAELVRLKVDLIIAAADPAVRAAKQATKTIPIVFVGVSDPVGQGFVSSLAQPGGNMTGYPSGRVKRKKAGTTQRSFPTDFSPCYPIPIRV
jgi:putative tryptophan/tyrosine transport system substrate-binding protein